MSRKAAMMFVVCRAALVGGALLFVLTASKNAARAQDDAPEPAGAAEEGDALNVLLQVANRRGAHEPTAAQRNFKTAPSVQLAQNGQVLLPIVIASKASPETRQYAQELAEYLRRISGAEFSIQTPDGQAVDFSIKKISLVQRKAEEEAREKLTPELLPLSGIVLGTKAEYSVPAELQAALDVRDINGRESYAIRASNNRVLLLSATQRGIYHPVYRMLHELGCRWLASGEHWEVVPSTPDLKWNLDITDRPTIATRNIAFMDGAMSKETVNGKVYDERAASGAWWRRNSLGSSVIGGVAHSWHRIFEAYNDEFLAHPEYFAQANGQRVVPITKDRTGKTIVQGVFAKLELGNPRVREICIEWALNFFRKNPDTDMISFSPTDGGGFSDSPESQRLGDVSDAVYGMVNDIARAVNKEFPGKMVGIYAYREIAGPPSFELEDNVYVELATLFNLSKYSNQELLELWPQRAKNFGFYTYFSYFDADGSQIPGGPISNINYAKTIPRDYAARNALIVTAQSSNAFGPHMRGYYLASKLLWNPNADADAILNDFYDKAYGPAKEVMKRFHGRIGRDAGLIITDNLLGAAFRDLQEASTLVANRPDILARLRDLKQYMTWIHLNREVNGMPRRTPEQKVEFRKAYEHMMRHAAAMRHTYMAQWNMIADRYGRGIAAEFKDISYVIKNKRGEFGNPRNKFGAIPGDRDAPNTWDGFAEATPESIEADFQESLKRLPDRELPQQKFNVNDLVPVVFPPSPGLPPFTTSPAANNEAFVRSEYYQGASPTYVVYSLAGEPIELQIQSGVRTKTRSTTWTLQKPDGKGGWSTLDKGEVASDMTFVPVSINVPGKGQYRLMVNAQNAGARINYRADKPFSILWSEAGQGAKDYLSPVFYVPKGTREIVYYFQSNNGASNTFVQPDGKQMPISNGVNTISVPSGMDGRVWGTSSRSAFRTQRFFNIPNIAAPSPEALLVPREVAEKDGLTIRTK